MNPFQKQLIVDGKPLCSLDGRPQELGVGPPEPPQKVTLAEFERDMRKSAASPQDPREESGT